MEQETIIRSISDTLTERPTKFRVHIRSVKRRERVLFFLGIRKSYRSFEIRPLVLGTIMRISKLILTINKNGLRGEEIVDTTYKLMANGKVMAQIIALAVTNQKELPDKELIRFFFYNLTPKELSSLVSIIMKGMDPGNFLNSIILIRGANLIEMTPQTQGSQIAPGNSSAV